MREVKVVLMGCGGVGKSALAIRFATGEFIPSYNPTIEDFYRHQLHIDGIGQTTMDILDTAGSEQFVSMRQLYISTGQAFALVYSVDSRKSFDNLRDIYREIVHARGKVPLVVVGNKGDVPKEQRQLTVDVVKEMVKKDWGVESRQFPLVIETSAKDDKNVFELFSHMARLCCTQPVKPITSKKIKKKSQTRRPSGTPRTSTLGRSGTSSKSLSLAPARSPPRERDGLFGGKCVIS